MKNLRYYFLPILLMLTMSLNAQDNRSQNEAIEKGKSDLVQILSESGKDFNFGLSADEVKRSKPAAAIPFKDLSFDRLLKYEGQEVSSLLGKTQKLVVPLVDGTRVITTISIAETSRQNYKVSELINQNYQNDLNQLPAEIRRSGFSGINIVYVPNLNTIIYMQKDVIYSSYRGNSLQKGLPAEEVMKTLQEAAVEFQRKYGDKLKEGNLLN